MKSMTPQARIRCSIVARTLAGTLGAYGLASIITALSSLLLARIGMDKVEAVVAATLASFLVFALIAMAVFHARSAARAWIWLLALALPAGLALFLRMPGAKG